MSRGVSERATAWEVWLTFHTSSGSERPMGYEHQCGTLGKIEQCDLGSIYCPGCRFEISHPEIECEPLYRGPER